MRILICDDEELIRNMLKEYLISSGYKVSIATDGLDCLHKLRDLLIDILILDLKMPKMGGIQVLKVVRDRKINIKILVLTGFGEINSAIEATKLGAIAFLQKPITPTELVIQLKKTVLKNTLSRRLNNFTSNITSTRKQLIGKSSALKNFYFKLDRMKRLNLPNILLKGKSGTGKTLVANIIHKESLNKNGLFVEVNCATLPYNLVEAELFGYEKGAFTDAKQSKKGLFEIANGGTIFLDEIGDLALSLQAKLLQVLESRKYRKIGGLIDLKLNAVLITATNKDLQKAVDKGEFRSDLFHRLNVIPIVLPSLYERKSDIEELSCYFINELNKKFSKEITGISSSALKVLKNYKWPGNIRELKNLIERIMILEKDNGLIDIIDLPNEIIHNKYVCSNSKMRLNNSSFILPDNGIDLIKLENDLLIQAFRKSNGNYSHAAKLLGVSRFVFRYRLNKLFENNINLIK